MYCFDSYINVDSTDIESILDGKSVVYITSAVAEGESRLKDAVERIRLSDFWKENNLDDASKIRIKFYCCRKTDSPLTSDEISDFQRLVSTNLANVINLQWCITDDPLLENRVRIIILCVK